jgi:NYN domain
MDRVAVYIDGFNLYHGRLEGHPELKWLDLEALGQRLAPQDQLVLIRFFTAWVSGKGDPGSPRRQQIYLRALRSLPLVEVHFGHFERREKERTLVHPIPGHPKRQLIWHTEEKGSDVNLATWLVLDGIDGRWDRAIVLTNDSDLEEPIKQANARFGAVHILSPRELTKGRDEHTYVATLAAAASSYKSLNPADLAASQLPDSVRLASGKTVRRPEAWGGPAAKAAPSN